MLSTIYWWSTVHEIEDLNPYLGTGWTVKMVCLIWGNILIHPTQKWPIVWSILTVHSKRLGCDCVTLTHTVWIGRGKGEGGMTYECMTSEVNQWKLNFLKKKNTRLNWWKGFLVWIVWRSLGPLGYFDFEFGGHTLKLLRRVITNVHAYQRVITCEVEQ